MIRTLTFLALALAVPVPASANLITNGDFTACPTLPFGAPCGSSWTFTNTAAVQIHTGGTASGNPGNFVRLESNGVWTSDPTASQTVAGLAPGQDYLLSWDYRLRVNFGNTFDRGPSFGIFLDTQTFASALFLGGTLSGTYISDSLVFTATSTTHTLIFAGELDNRSNGRTLGTDVSYNIDNISLDAAPSNPVPEPATIVVLVIGLLGIGARAHVRPDSTKGAQ